jgi:hypothetical protein
MLAESKTVDSGARADGLKFDDQDRRPCQSAPTERVDACDRTRNIRCHHAERELYRNHFPAER